MIGLTTPFLLVLIVPWAMLCALLWRSHRATLQWIEERVGERFRHRLSLHDGRRLGLHVALLFVAGALLCLAAAGPYRLASAANQAALEDGEAPLVIFALDASLSMGARDATRGSSSVDPVTRFEQARSFAGDLLQELPGHRAALLTFSGTTVLHSPPTTDHPALGSLLATLRYHLFHEAMGTRFSTLLREAAALAASHVEAPVTVVLLSDGELPEEDPWPVELEALASAGIPVHTVAVGGEAPVSMRLFDPDDLLAGRDPPRVLLEYSTGRQSEPLRRIAEESGGSMAVPERGDWVSTLLGSEGLEHSAGLARPGARLDLSTVPLLAFALLWLVEILVLADRGRRLPGDAEPPADARWPAGARRAAPGFVLVLALPLFAADGVPLWQRLARVAGAYGINAAGLAAADEGEHDRAILHYGRALRHQVRPHVLWVNLGRSHHLAGRQREAHHAFERALELAPRYPPAHFQDGVALYRWGLDELDAEACDVERTRPLWQTAAERFRRAGDGLSALRDEARANHRATLRALDLLDEIERRCSAPPEQPPEASPDSPPPPSPTSQPPPSPNEGSASPPPATPSPPPEPEPGPLSAEERDQIAAALGRIRQEAAAGPGIAHAEESQISPENARKAKSAPEAKGGKRLWW